MLHRYRILPLPKVHRLVPYKPPRLIIGHKKGVSYAARTGRKRGSKHPEGRSSRHPKVDFRSSGVES